jgi:hypothetical protein
MSLFSEILQEQRVHRPLESDMQVGDVALGERHDVDAGQRQSFEQPGGVLLVAAESVERFGEDHVESPVQRIAHQRLETRTEKRRTGDRVIRIFLRDRPTLPLSERSAHAHLIGDRRVPLVVRGIARVDADFHGFTSMDDRCVASKLRLERFARRLSRQNSYERANRIVAWRINRRARSATNDWRNTSSSLASFASSFGHDTPAHVERRFAIRGVRDGDEWAAPECGSERAVLGIERGRCVRRDDRASWTSARSNQSVGIGMLSERCPRASFRNAPHRAMWRSAVRHERDVSNIRLVASAVNGDQTSTIAQKPDSSGAQAGSTPAGRARRTVEAQRRALTPPSQS